VGARDHEPQTHASQNGDEHDYEQAFPGTTGSRGAEGPHGSTLEARDEARAEGAEEDAMIDANYDAWIDKDWNENRWYECSLHFHGAYYPCPACRDEAADRAYDSRKATHE
jgi:hypothetical protein